MTVTEIGSASKIGFRYGNPAIACDGATLHTQCRQLATVITVEGEVDEANLDLVIRRATRCVLPEKAVVLDLRSVTAFGHAALALLDAVDARACALGVEWALVAGPVVQGVLDASPADADYVADYVADDSVPQALHRFAEGSTARRRLLPLLTRAV